MQMASNVRTVPRMPRRNRKAGLLDSFFWDWDAPSDMRSVVQSLRARARRLYPTGKGFLVGRSWAGRGRGQARNAGGEMGLGLIAISTWS